MGKKIFKLSHVLQTSTPKFLLVLLPVGHWMKIYTCPD